MALEIRPAAPEDYPDIYALTQKAFQQDFESMLIAKLRNKPNFIPELSLVAVEHAIRKGYVLFSIIKIKATQQSYETLALAPLAVHPRYQNQGIGKKLVLSGLESAKNLGYQSVIVLGHPEYYSTLGFKKASLWQIHCPFEVPDEAFMAIELKENALQGKAGMVEYPPEFIEM